MSPSCNYGCNICRCPHTSTAPPSSSAAEGQRAAMVHIRFSNDDEELPDAPAASAAAATEPAAGPSWAPAGAPLLASCCCCERVDNKRSPSYVFRATCNASRDALVASTSDNLIKAYALASGQLSHVCDLKGHSNTITDVGFTDGSSMLHSSSTDGTVRGWDLRTRSQSESYKTQQELYSYSVLEHLLAAGGQGEVFFWDRRKPAQPLSTLPDTHMDEVTQVKIHPSQHVISASGDGLVAVHDMSKGVADEDDNFAAALNVGTSVEEVGLYGGSGERLWVRTGTETLHLWDWRIATLSDKEGGHGAFAEWPEARATAAQAAASSPVASVFEEVGYLAGCQWDASSGRLMLVAGVEGSVGFFPLVEQPGPSGDGAMLSAAMQAPVVVLQGVHTEVVRTVHCFGPSSPQEPFCVSGGEDGCLCLWTLSPAPGAPSALAAAAGFPVQGPPASEHGEGDQYQGYSDAMEEGAGPSRKEGKRFGAVGRQCRKQSPY